MQPRSLATPCGVFCPFASSRSASLSGRGVERSVLQKSSLSLRREPFCFWCAHAGSASRLAIRFLRSSARPRLPFSLGSFAPQWAQDAVYRKRKITNFTNQLHAQLCLCDLSVPFFFFFFVFFPLPLKGKWAEAQRFDQSIPSSSFSKKGKKKREKKNTEVL